MAEMNPVLESKTASLHSYLTGLGRVVVAYSGGVDSAILAVAADRALGADSVAVTAVSPSLARRERLGASELARQMGFAHREVATQELGREEYARNGADRCFWCKTELFEVLGPIATEMDAAIAVGTNLDDLGDHRPGIQAARKVVRSAATDVVRPARDIWSIPP